MLVVRGTPIYTQVLRVRIRRVAKDRAWEIMALRALGSDGGRHQVSGDLPARRLRAARRTASLKSNPRGGRAEQ
jgi:hypothetical protein